ncbi:ATP-binding cassette domain-containing protein [Dactylosporangium vinaceum]|uniref:FHA domain-containing protein n=1 Tax=Dactylosporangium vinaceum TaxID=53362 RepID=A0ABV5MIM7_9ACTN|nr:ATP-binding cassette domain-containing protein [Dactylosporangium vinaceum]UAB97623.1 ATP-binding cassette domain-containing protein [Dactylosporangium vinaceum]
MSSLVLIVEDGDERRLPEQDPHYMWIDRGELRVSTNPPSHSTCIGNFVSEFGVWRFHTGPAECPPELRINGRPVDEDIELPGDRAEVALSADPYSEPPPATPRPRRPANVETVSGRQYLIGPLGSNAQLALDDPAVVEDHARVEIDDTGAWWITALNGEVFVDDEPVASAKLAPGAQYRIGQRMLTVPSPRRRGRGLPVTCDELSARHGPNVFLDNVSLTIAAGDFAVVHAREPLGATMLLGLIAGVYRPDHGTVRIGDSSRRGGPGVRWVPANDDLYDLLTVDETLGGVGADRRAEILSWVGLSRDGGRQVRALDPGERKRLAIARELAERPALLVVFETPDSAHYAIGEDRELMSRLATISEDIGCTVLMAARSRNNLDQARKVIILDRRGGLRYAGPAGRRADHLAALDVFGEESGPGRSDSVIQLPAMRPRVGTPGYLDGLAGVLRQQALLYRSRGNGLHALLGALAVAGAALVFVSFGLARLEMAVVAVAIALVAGGTDLVTARPVLARERRSGVSAGTIVTGRLIVHGGVLSAAAVFPATAAAWADAALPAVPGLSAWLSCYLALLLAMLLALAATMLAAAASPRERLDFAVLAGAAVTAVATVLLAWVLLAASWPVSLPLLLVLFVSAAVATAAMLENRLTSPG